MSLTKTTPAYLVVSPVKDEEKHVRRTLDSMIQQTVRPVQWVIVDDGSTDRTPEIVAQYAERHAFIKMVRHTANTERGPGSPVIRAFQAGYDQCRAVKHDLIVKLDCDLSFGPDYFERLLRYFEGDRQLGIASGVYWECRNGNDWFQIKMPAYHAAGAAKALRKSCYDQIGGFLPTRGWDTVDEIRAMSKGWRTTHFADLEMKHWKAEGTGIGQWRTSWMHGEIHYRTGGGFLFFLLKAVHRMTRRPFVLGALAMVCGYLNATIRRKPRLVTTEEARTYKKLLNSRIAVKLKPNAAVEHSRRSVNRRTASHVWNLWNL